MFLLNRPLQWEADTISYEADHRHVEIILRDLGLGPDAKAVVSPNVKLTAADIESPGLELDRHAATMYRAVAARANYLCLVAPSRFLMSAPSAVIGGIPIGQHTH